MNDFLLPITLPVKEFIRFFSTSALREFDTFISALLLGDFSLGFCCYGVTEKFVLLLCLVGDCLVHGTPCIHCGNVFLVDGP